MITIYEVMYSFLSSLFPADILVSYKNILELTAFSMTYILIFGIIVIPLYRLATFFHKRGR